MRNLILFVAAIAVLSSALGCSGTDKDAGKLPKQTIGESPKMPDKPQSGPALD